MVDVLLETMDFDKDINVSVFETNIRSEKLFFILVSTIDNGILIACSHKGSSKVNLDKKVIMCSIGGKIR